jgi:hypothetical protein
MKVKVSVLALILVFLLGASISSVRAAAPLQYLGETTWSLYITNDIPDTFLIGQTLTLTGGITRVADNYYLFQGTLPFGGENNPPHVLSGGGARVGNQLILTISESYYSPGSDRSNGIMNFTLNLSDLSGTVTEIGQGYLVPGGGMGHGYLEGTLTRTGPMVPLTQALGGPLSLLLLK